MASTFRPSHFADAMLSVVGNDAAVTAHPVPDLSYGTLRTIQTTAASAVVKLATNNGAPRDASLGGLAVTLLRLAHDYDADCRVAQNASMVAPRLCVSLPPRACEVVTTLLCAARASGEMELVTRVSVEDFFGLIRLQSNPAP